MLNQAILDKLETAGYHTPPPSYKSAPGHNGLIVLLHQKPMGTSFDPQSLHLKVHNWDDTIHWTTFEIDTAFPSERSICPGKAVVASRSGDEVSFFVFGGKLEGMFMSDRTFYSVQSDAPILSLTQHTHDVDTQLAFDVEALLAQEQAELGWKDQFYWQHLMAIDPFQLYVTSINTVLNRYEASPALRQAEYHYYEMLKEERERLTQAQKWPDPVPTLSELLQRKTTPDTIRS
jgi:hypothetical protein